MQCSHVVLAIGPTSRGLPQFGQEMGSAVAIADLPAIEVQAPSSDNGLGWIVRETSTTSSNDPRSPSEHVVEPPPGRGVSAVDAARPSTQWTVGVRRVASGGRRRRDWLTPRGRKGLIKVHTCLSSFADMGRSGGREWVVVCGLSGQGSTQSSVRLCEIGRSRGRPG